MGLVAVVMLVAASALGATMFLPWWWRGRKRLYGDNDPAGSYPADDHFPMLTVQTHGGLADLTWVLLIVALLLTGGRREDEERTRSAVDAGVQARARAGSGSGSGLSRTRRAAHEAATATLGRSHTR